MFTKLLPRRGAASASTGSQTLSLTTSPSTALRSLRFRLWYRSDLVLFLGLVLAQHAQAAVHDDRDVLPPDSPHPAVLPSSNPPYADGREAFHAGYFSVVAEPCVPLSPEERSALGTEANTPRDAALRQFHWRQVQHYRAQQSETTPTTCYYPGP